jgi:hypothetical protein
MAPNRIMRGRTMRRALLLALLGTLLAASLAACGGGGGAAGNATEEKEADAQVLEQILARQRAAVGAYEEVLPDLRGADLLSARRFRAQEQEHVDATTKALRGLDGEAAPPEEAIETGDLKTRRDALTFLYELESATIDAELSALGKLDLGWPRPLLGSMVADQAQRLALIRRALGAKPLETVPEAFETGETPAPEGMMKR